jgi:hypothetical protein
MSLFPTGGAHQVNMDSTTAVNDSPGYVCLKWFTPTGKTTQVWQHCVRAINKTGGATVVGRTYILVESGTDGEAWTAVTPAALASVPRSVAVANEVIANGAFGYFTIRGHVMALVNGTTDVAADDRLKLAPGTSAVAFIKDSAETVSSVGKACAAQAADSDVLTLVLLHGRPVVVNT